MAKKALLMTVGVVATTRKMMSFSTLQHRIGTLYWQTILTLSYRPVVKT